MARVYPVRIAITQHSHLADLGRVENAHFIVSKTAKYSKNGIKMKKNMHFCKKITKRFANMHFFL